jgi:hypothetical protein
MQAADFYLVTGPEAPMNIFSPSWVYCLSNEELEHIAGEELSERRKRHRLQKQMKDLEAGRRILLCIQTYILKYIGLLSQPTSHDDDDDDDDDDEFICPM